MSKFVHTLKFHAHKMGGDGCPSAAAPGPGPLAQFQAAFRRDLPEPASRHGAGEPQRHRALPERTARGSL